MSGILVEEKDFTLEKVKIEPGKNLEVICNVIMNKDGEMMPFAMKIKPTHMASQPLLDKIHSLKPILSKICSKDESSQKFINVSFLEIKGKEDSRGYTIGGVQASASKQLMNFKTHKVNFSDETYGDEGQIEEECDEIESLVYSYLFEQEQALITMGLKSAEDEADEAEEAEVPEENEPEVENLEE